MPKRTTPSFIVSSSQSADSKDSRPIHDWCDEVQSTTGGRDFDRVLASRSGHHSSWACPSIKTSFMTRTASFLEWLRWRFAERNWASEDKIVLIDFVKDLLDLAEVDLFQAHYKMQLNFDPNNRIKVHCRYHSRDDDLSSDLYDDWDAVLFRDVTGPSDDDDDGGGGFEGDGDRPDGETADPGDPYPSAASGADMRGGRGEEDLSIVAGPWLSRRSPSTTRADQCDDHQSSPSPPASPSPAQRLPRPRPRPFVRSSQPPSGVQSSDATDKGKRRQRSQSPSPVPGNVVRSQDRFASAASTGANSSAASLFISSTLPYSRQIRKEVGSLPSVIGPDTVSGEVSPPARKIARRRDLRPVSIPSST
ncbi:hypothetical protein OC834_004092 [Tilletia horrida]|nr:hypothetical protein OC834_004092 [Tilletia horrida]